MHFHPVPAPSTTRGSATSFAPKAAAMIADQMTVLWPRASENALDPRQNSQRMFSTPPHRRNRRGQQQTGSASIVIPHADIIYQHGNA